jgi:CRISPR-associated endonuclease Csn1
MTNENKREPVPTILGLDIGTNSIGWALIETDPNTGRPLSICDCGVRIFQEAVDAQTRTPKNAARRSARLLRRVLARRAQRKRKLMKLLVEHGLLPAEIAADGARPEIILNTLGDPYELRARALDRAIQLHEIGRVLLHLCARRGFLSNRKAHLAAYLAEEFSDYLAKIDDTDELASAVSSDDIGKVKDGIKRLSEEIKSSGCRTLGEYLYRLDRHTRKRARFTSRQMYLDEFDQIWQSQARYHALLTDDLKMLVHQVIFFQRPLRSQKELVGKCLLEPGRKRAAKARLEVQQFRIWQDINHLEIQDPQSRTWRRLTDDQREKLFRELHAKKSLTWTAVRKLLGIHKGERINLEESKDKLIGNRTWIDIATRLGERWGSMSDPERLALLEDLLTISDLKARARRLREHWNFSRDEQYELCTWEPEPGYANHSLKAIRAMLPYLKRGAIYSEARKAAGYTYEVVEKNKPFLGEPPYVRNPVAQKALYQLRRVVNAVIRRYGKPAHITVELAREMKLSRAQKKALDKQNKQNRAANQKAAELIAQLTGVEHPSYEDKLKYRLWEECNHTCPYTGKSISLHELFSDAVDIEHILPYHRTLDDSYMNKTICCAEFNRNVKRNQTPWEALGGDPLAWEQLLQRIRTWPKAKRDRMERRSLDRIEDFISRQLNDTRIICRETLGYLKELGVDVCVSRGALTADLRHHWGLNSLISSSDGEKERSDHRHHAVDALVIALTTRRLLQKLSEVSSKQGARSLKDHLRIDLPWRTFREDAERAIDKIVISHATTRKISGALHEDTAYGLIQDGRYVYRKALNALFKRENAKKIVDPQIRKIVIEHLERHENDPKRAFCADSLPLLKDGKEWRPIKKVRVFAKLKSASVFPVRDRDGKSYKYFKYGSNHHVEILESQTTGKRNMRFVTTMEAAARARQKGMPIYDRSAPEGWTFLMSLGINDMVEVSRDGGSGYYRVQKLDGGNGRIYLRHHLSATTDDKDEGLVVRAKGLVSIVRKLSVDPLGHISTAND